MATTDAISQLRSYLRDVEQPAQLTVDDIYLALWLNLKQSDVRKAEAAIRDTLAWWKAKDIPSLLQEAFPPALTNKLPIFLDGVGKDGLPVAYVRLASLDLQGLVSQFEIPHVVRYALQNAVNGQRTALEINRLRYNKLGDEALSSARGFVAVIDACGVTRRHLPSLTAINMFIQIAQEVSHLPSGAKAAHIIGVNTLLLTIVKPVTPLLSAVGITLKLYGTDEKTWEPELSQLVDMKTLEEFRERVSRFEAENDSSA